MLKSCDSTINDLNLKLSSPSSEVTLGTSFTPLKDLASTNELVSDEASYRIQASPEQAITCSITETKSSRSLFIECEKVKPKVKPKVIEVPTNESDPTQKASEMLTKTLLEQLEQHQKRGRKTEAKESKSGPICTRSQCQKRYSETSTKVRVGSKKRKLKATTIKSEKPAKKTKLLQESSIKRTKASSMVNDFGNLKMVPLEQYEIPFYISDIENKTDLSHLSMINHHIKNSVSDPDQYIHAYSALLYFNETAESISLQDFNQRFIRLSYSNNCRIFQIKISVCFIYNFSLTIFNA